MTKLKAIAIHTFFATILFQPVFELAQTPAQHREAQREQDAAAGVGNRRRRPSKAPKGPHGPS